MSKIMIIEDDIKLCELITSSLEKYNFEVSIVNNFNNIENEFNENNPDLLLLDITLPYFDGFYFCRRLRRKTKIPIIIISSKNSTSEQIRGIELGADDYITKPFLIDFLIIKIQSTIRRVYGEYSNSSKNIIEVNGIKLDENTFKVFFKNKTIDLSKNEFKILKKFLENVDKIITREEFLVELWDESSFVDDNTLTVNITRVKSKLSDIGIINTIKTKRGSGYIFDISNI